MSHDQDGLFRDRHFIFEKTFLSSFEGNQNPLKRTELTVQEIQRILSHLDNHNPSGTK